MWEVYYWVSMIVTFNCALYVPTRNLKPVENITGSLIIALFGFLVWPFVALAAYETWKKKHEDAS